MRGSDSLCFNLLQGTKIASRRHSSCLSMESRRFQQVNPSQTLPKLAYTRASLPCHVPDVSADFLRILASLIDVTDLKGSLCQHHFGDADHHFVASLECAAVPKRILTPYATSVGYQLRPNGFLTKRAGLVLHEVMITADR